VDCGAPSGARHASAAGSYTDPASATIDGIRSRVEAGLDHEAFARPAPALGNKAPLEFCDTELGAGGV
jgi:hypothetical protein